MQIGGNVKIPCQIFFVLAFFITQTNNAALSQAELEKYQKFLEGQGLYLADDDVEIITNNNFKEEILNQPQAVLLEFYNSWCGFCQRFAPSWKALGTDLKPWKDVVRVAAFDCSDEHNSDICRDYEIMAYPTLRYFHENYQEGPKNLGLTVLKGDDVASHRANLIEVIINEQLQGRGAMYPNLIPYNYSDLNRLFEFEGVHQDVDYLFLVIENPGTFYGPAVALDLHKTPQIYIRHAFSNNTNLMDHLKLSDDANLPFVIAVERTYLNRYDVLNKPNTKIENRVDVRELIVNYAKSKGVLVETKRSKEIFTGKWINAEVPQMDELLKERARQALKERVKKMGDVVFQVDLENALRYSLKHEISAVKIIKDEKLKALRAYLKVLKKYFPFGQSGQEFLSELLDTVSSKNEVMGKEVESAVKEAEKPNSRVFSSPAKWLGCMGSNSHFRGYPCGLWKMFHYLTVNAADNRDSNANPLEVLDAMHGYIKNYFGCAECSQHFQEMAQKRGLWNVTSPESAIVWLWMAHNQVNKRLSGDPTEDPEFPKVQFPLPELCSQCRYPNSTYNFYEVSKYLKQVYGSVNVRYIGADTSIIHGIDFNGNSAAENSTGGFFKALDTSMCFILYVACFLLLALLIRMFLKRGYRKKPYVHDLLGKV